MMSSVPQLSSSGEALPHLIVSACLLGQPVRYDGKAKLLSDGRLQRWQAEGRVVLCCPELAGGLCVPRAPAELTNGRVLTQTGEDLTEAYCAGARAMLALAQERNCNLALLTDGSPSCGSNYVHAGRFDGTTCPGEGITAALLRAHGVEVYAPTQLRELALRMDGAA